MRNKDQIYLEDEFSQINSKPLLENRINLLFKFGFSSNQSKVYLYLNKMGNKTASQLSKNLNIPRTETYHLLKTLQEKGCVFRIHEKPMKFGVISIEAFLAKWIISEKNKIKKLEETLHLIQKLKSSTYFIATSQKII
jgi:sugar-specific transcriptional regulator TrmB